MEKIQIIGRMPKPRRPVEKFPEYYSGRQYNTVISYLTMGNIFSWFDDIAVFDGDFNDMKDVQDAYNVILSIVCVICGGLASGLTMGMMSLDTTKLQIKAMTGTENEIKIAKAILPIVEKHHLLLVTLLLFNALSMEALPIFLGSLVPNWVAILLSVTLVLIFGEIIPSALFTGPQQLFVAGRFVSLVNFLMVLFFPVAYPISIFLDKFFGHEEDSPDISRNELEALMRLQQTRSLRVSGESLEGTCLHDHHLSFKKDESIKTEKSTEKDLTGEEVDILTGILRLSNLSIKDVIIKFDRMYSLSADTYLNEESLEDILERGYSRIPVYNRKDKQCMLGFLLAKSLIVVNPSNNVQVRSLALREPLVVSPKLGLLEILKLFQVGRSHLALVSENPETALDCLRKGLRPPPDAQYIGLITLEDVLEKILQDDIVDETDVTNLHRSSSAEPPLRSIHWDNKKQNSFMGMNYRSHSNSNDTNQHQSDGIITSYPNWLITNNNGGSNTCCESCDKVIEMQGQEYTDENDII